MKVKDLETGNILESINDLVCEQWVKYPQQYQEIKETKSTGKIKDKE